MKATWNHQEDGQMVPLHAGPLTAWFDTESWFLRHIRAGDNEIVRAIYGAVRDAHWNTVIPAVENLKIATQERSFVISFDAVSQRQEIEFGWHCHIEGSEEGVVRFQFEGVARSDFLKNRVGVCVLHPIAECAGIRCRVETPEGLVQEGVFPTGVSPNQAFLNIRRLRYEVAPGVVVHVEFEGEVFEMEDQRNWSDASFKTYSTPQALGWPKLLQKGATVRHVITVRCQPTAASIPSLVRGRVARLSLAAVSCRERLNVGVELNSLPPTVSSHLVERLRTLRLGHVRFVQNLFGPQFELESVPKDGGVLHAELWRAFSVARDLGVGLQVCVRLGEDAERRLRGFAQGLRSVCSRLGLDLRELEAGPWVILHRDEPCTSEKWLQLARECLGDIGKSGIIGGGSDAFFAELNRNRPPRGAAYPHVCCFPASPQTHTIDRAAMIENLAALRHNAQTAGDFSGKQVMIAPIRLKPRDASMIGVDRPADVPPLDFDRRQLSLFGAVWTVGCLAELAVCDSLFSATVFEAVGWHGLMGTGRDKTSSTPVPEHPGEFLVHSSWVYPLYHVFADFADGVRFHAVECTLPLDVGGFCFVDSKASKNVVIASFKSERQVVEIETGSCRGRVRYLDERNVGAALSDPEGYRASSWVSVEAVEGRVELELWPYAVARLVFEPSP